MCGLFGAIGKNFNPQIIRILAVLNESRGSDAFGFFDSKGRWVRQATDPIKCLQTPSFCGFLQTNDTWLMAGHTRHASQFNGRDKTENAHPFRYDSILGSHNGFVCTKESTTNYDVDSMMIFDLLNQHASDYQQALQDIDGYWGLSWFDAKEKAFYLQCHEATLSLITVDDVIYYSSDEQHLYTALGCSEGAHKFTSGETRKYTFKNRRVDETLMPVFTSNMKSWSLTTPQRANGMGQNWQNNFYGGQYNYSMNIQNKAFDTKSGSKNAFDTRTDNKDDTSQSDLETNEMCCVCNVEFPVENLTYDTVSDFFCCDTCYSGIPMGEVPWIEDWKSGLTPSIE